MAWVIGFFVILLLFIIALGVLVYQANHNRAGKQLDAAITGLENRLNASWERKIETMLGYKVVPAASTTLTAAGAVTTTVESQALVNGVPTKTTTTTTG